MIKYIQKVRFRGSKVIFYQSENLGKSYECRKGVHENWYVSPHIHEYSELAFSKARETCVYVDGKRYIVPENHLIFIRPNQVHEYNEETSSILCCAVFSNDFAPIFSSLTLGKELLTPVIDFSDYTPLLEAFENADKDDTVKICGLLNLICSIILKRGEWVSNRSGSQRVNNPRQIIDYISSHFREDIRLSDLAKALGYHEKYLSSTLHALTGMNFRRFLASYRIDYAKKLLKNESTTKLSISDIAMQCGFSSINTFNRVFLSFCGVTPTQYRNQYKIIEKA